MGALEGNAYQGRHRLTGEMVPTSHFRHLLAICPPSTGSATPLMNDASSETR